MRRMGLESSLFNLELMVDPQSERLSILEVNPRICGQFGDLYARVSGPSSFAVQLALAAGDPPVLERRPGPFEVAASCPLRTFEPVRVARAPQDADLAAVHAAWPDVQVWIECERGQTLCDFESFEDGASARYAVVNLGAQSPAALERKLDQVRALLGFELQPLAPAGDGPASDTCRISAPPPSPTP
jgi:hypothetical protein